MKALGFFLYDDKGFLSNPNQWPANRCCVKKKDHKSIKDCGIIFTPEPLSIYDHDFNLLVEFESVDQLLAAGWIVD